MQILSRWAVTPYNGSPTRHHRTYGHSAVCESTRLSVNDQLAQCLETESFLMASEVLAKEIGAFVADCGSARYQEALGNVTRDHVYCGRREAMLEVRRKLEARTLVRRKAVNLATKPKVSTNSSTQLCQKF